ncbi:MAG: replicative DNA helicase [Clostridiales bacterium]|nr:replicative DNA helicase [Clostridiales bacterium]
MADKKELMGRVPPQNIEAEQSVLGAMLLDKDIIPLVMEILGSEHFYRQDHKEIFDAMMELFEAAKPVDIITVSERLALKGTLESVGGLEYISELSNIVPSSENAGYYAKIVKEKSIRRDLIKVSSNILNLGYDSSDEINALLEQAEKGIFKVSQDMATKGVVPIKEVLVDTFDKLEGLYNNKDDVSGIPTGFKDLDYKLSGLQNSDLVLIAARPAMGKTSFALNIAQNIAIKKNVPVAIFSLEMSKEQLVTRMLCCEAMVDASKMKTGKLEDDDWAKIAGVLGTLSDAPIYIDDTPGTSVSEIGAKCRKLKLEKNLGVVVIDYLQLMKGRGRSESRQQEISEISRSLKILAKELNIPVITLSQLSRAAEQRQDHRPMLSDLRESGAIEQDADIVMFLYREDYYNEATEKKNISEVIIAKHRNGSTGTIELAWLSQYTKFGNLNKSVR